MSDCNSTIFVQTLVGSGQLPFYLNCLKSLTQKCVETLNLIIHTDGSLSNSDEQTILHEFPQGTVQIADKNQSKSNTLDNLRGYPNCQKLRQKSIWGTEFFDPLFTKPEDPISFYVDADILFVKKFSGLFDKEKVKGGAVFLRDINWDAYCIRPWHLAGFSNKPSIVHGITTALVCWDRDIIDWDYLEWFLGQEYLHSIPEWVLPTAQAGLAARCDSKTVSARQLVNLYPNAKIHEETFGLHLLGSYREDWLKELSKLKISPSPKTMNAAFEKCKTRGMLGYSVNITRRWLNTRVNKW